MELKITPVAYGWLIGTEAWSFFLNGDESHQNKPTVLSSDKDGWKITYKNTVITLGDCGSISHIHVSS